MERYQKNAQGQKVETDKYQEWKKSIRKFKLRKRGYSKTEIIDLEKMGPNSGGRRPTVVQMLKAMTQGMMQKVKANTGKSASKKAAGAATKHIRQKV